MGPRAALSMVLIVGGFVLLVAIGVGMAMGNHVLGQAVNQDPIAPTPLPIPTPSGGEGAASAAWKHTTILSVATDPAFPDPRVTPEPEPIVVPTRTPTPRPSPTSAPRRPLPVATTEPQPSETIESPPQDEDATPKPAVVRTPGPARTVFPVNRGTTPPYVIPSLNP